MTNQLKILRTIRSYTQESLAQQVGVSRQTIHAIETNKYVPSTVLALKIAQCLGVSVEQIFQLEPGDMS